MADRVSRPARHHLFEFEDLTWFPALFRNAITNWLATAFEGAYSSTGPLVAKLLENEGATQVVDLCSGGSGPWKYLKPEVDAALKSRNAGSISLTLTDLYPNVPAFTQIAGQIDGAVDFAAQSVDARNVPDDLKGVRTLFSSFHHLKPEDAKAVLADAARAGRSIGVFDFTQRDWRVVRGVMTFVPKSMLQTYRSWAPTKIYQLPLVPLIIATSVWDAVVSQLRSYCEEDLAAMTADLGRPDYTWETGTVPQPGSGDPIAYVIGYPVAS